jgi:hypothetical protein
MLVHSQHTWLAPFLLPGLRRLVAAGLASEAEDVLTDLVRTTLLRADVAAILATDLGLT